MKCLFQRKHSLSTFYWNVFYNLKTWFFCCLNKDTETAIWMWLLYQFPDALNKHQEVGGGILKSILAFFLRWSCPASTPSCSVCRAVAGAGLFLVPFTLVADDYSEHPAERRHPAASSKPKVASLFKEAAFAVLQAFIFISVTHSQSQRAAGRMTSPWAEYSRLDKSIFCIVCRNRFSLVYACVGIGKGYNFAIKY